MAAKKSNAGRPTIFDRSMIDKAKEYVLFFITTKPEDLENHTEVIPTIAGMAIFLGVSRSTVYEWEKINKEFSDILEWVMDVQESLIVNNGLKGKFNSTISKLMLTKHGYSDKQEVDMTVNPLSALIDEIGNEARNNNQESKE